MTPSPALSGFLQPVRDWFTAELGEPTAAQKLSWPVIANRENALLLAPTGSGKTLSAFLACLDRLWRQEKSAGVKVLYLSPLKALNNDIDRNLRRPLEGVLETARRFGNHLRPLSTAVRTGDTTTQERQQQLRRPPDILITTPESLHLLLTSKGRESLVTVETVIVDEIHSLCGNKRGVFLSLLLERLEELVVQQNSGSVQRIGLSATQKPLELIGQYLGGGTIAQDGRWTPRPVKLIDAGMQKKIDIRVVHPCEAFGPLPEKSIWPSIYRLLREQIETHSSTLVFSNDRRAAERITAGINGDDEKPMAHAHHGSISLEKRRETEEALKEGRLRAVVATASLEMGIDMGSVDLVCQVESPGSVSRSIQRLGRAGHGVGQISKGIMIPKTSRDLSEMSALSKAMLEGDIETTTVPGCCLDILAQQVVAMVAMNDWPVAKLHSTIRRAYSYRDLTAGAFDSVLEMLSGRFRLTRPSLTNQLPNPTPLAKDSPGKPSALEALQPRIVWDRVHNLLQALPGTRHLALTGGGAIPDTGNLAAVTPEGTRVGELDEEFVFERRVGDAFLLGTNVWRIESIEADRVRVVPAPGALAVMPFWRGEGPGRTLELGNSMGRILREIVQKLESPDRIDWISKTCGLDHASARDLFRHVSRQILIAGCVPDDRTVLVEAARDPLGDWQILVLTPLGTKFHLGLRMALESVLSARFGYRPQCIHHDDGVLVRLADMAEPPLELLDWLDPSRIEDLILAELADSPLFAVRFRQNASRSLLLPRALPGKRSPLWLQRLKGKDLLQVARRHPDFPIIAETYRELLNDHLEIAALRSFLEGIQSREINVVTRRAEAPCPFAADILFDFTASRMYQQDSVEAESKTWKELDKSLLDEVLQGKNEPGPIDPRAVALVDRRLRRQGLAPRTATEMLDHLIKLGDILESEWEASMPILLGQLQNNGTARRTFVNSKPTWIAKEYEADYESAFGEKSQGPERLDAAGRILARYLETRALVGLDDILIRYPFDSDWTARKLREWAAEGRLIAVRDPVAATVEYSAPSNWDQLRRGSLAIQRREIVSVPPEQYVSFLIGWQGVGKPIPFMGSDQLSELLDRLALHAAPLDAWESGIFPSRLGEFPARLLDAWCVDGEGCWMGLPDKVAFVPRPLLAQLPIPPGEVGEHDTKIFNLLMQSGASFLEELSLRSNIPPSEVRSALWRGVAAGLVSNDRLETCRTGPPKPHERIPDMIPAHKRARIALREGFAKPNHKRGEGRWFLLPYGKPSPEESAINAARILLRRYGIVCRDLAIQCPMLPPWRTILEVLDRLELSGEIRRGYFVEGFQGAQFALPEALASLQDSASAVPSKSPLVAIHSLDPANLYGSGAPLDLPIMEGGKRSFQRRAGNWIVLKGGVPLILVEKDGSKITILPNARHDEMVEAIRILRKTMLAAGKGKWTIESVNDEPACRSHRLLLEQSGFVSDHLSMTLYGPITL